MTLAHACANLKLFGLCQGWAANAGICLERATAEPCDQH
jgi:hypothetical protein